MTDIATTTGEVLLGRERTPGLGLEMDFLDHEELSKRLASVPFDEVVYFGIFPAIDDDGVSAVSYIPLDEDRTVRPQPV